MDSSLALQAAGFPAQNFAAAFAAAPAPEGAAFSELLAFALAAKAAPGSGAAPKALAEDFLAAALRRPAQNAVPSQPGIAPQVSGCPSALACAPAAPLPMPGLAPVWPWQAESFPRKPPAEAAAPERRAPWPSAEIQEAQPGPAQFLCAAAALALADPQAPTPAAGPDYSRLPCKIPSPAFPGAFVSADPYSDKAGPGLRVAAELPGGGGLLIEARMGQSGEPALRVFTDSPLAAAALAAPGSPLGPQGSCSLVDSASLRKMRRKKSPQADPPETSLLENIMESKAYCA